MKPYSMDLRSRIVPAYSAQEGSQADLAECFHVSERWVQNLLRQQRETGSIAPLPHGGGRERIIGADKEPLLLSVLAETPDASLDELCERCGVNGSSMSMARALQRLQVTRKKSRCCTRSNKNRRCNGNAKPGKGR